MFAFPPDAFRLDWAFFTGLGAAMLIADYDYWGYYNVCFFGGEVRDPGRNIPRARTAFDPDRGIDLHCNEHHILGVIPWREFDQPPTRGNIN